MIRRRTFSFAGISAIAACGLTGFRVSAAERAVQMIVPFASGGGFDAIARPFAERLSSVLGQNVIIENRAGAGGALGADLVSRAPADGHTLLFANSSIVTLPLLQQSNKTTESIKTLVPVCKIGSVSTGVAINPKLAATSLQELVKLSKTKPLTFGTPGVGTVPHLIGEMLNVNGDMSLVHVPYKGTSPAITDAIGGQIDMVMVPISATAPFIRAGKLRGIAVTSSHRSPLMPELPTFIESGYPKVQGETWYGLFAPAGTPVSVLQRLAEASRVALAQPELASLLRTAGYEVSYSNGNQLANLYAQDTVRWGEVIGKARIKAE